jgi:hypothetical protein
MRVIDMKNSPLSWEIHEKDALQLSDRNREFYNRHLFLNEKKIVF